MDFNSAVAFLLMPVLGLAVGNYATSLLYRLPLGKVIANDPPYCDSCHHYLAVRDLFPFFSWAINRGCCRFCGAAIPPLYALVELACVGLFTLNWLHYGMGEDFLLLTSSGVLLILLIAYYWQESVLRAEIVIALAGIAATYRTLHDASVFPMIHVAYIYALSGTIIWLMLRKSLQNSSWRQFFVAPLLAGAMSGYNQFLPLLAAIMAAFVVLLFNSELRDKSLPLSCLLSIVVFLVLGRL